MEGKYRIPTLLKQLDTMTKDKLPETYKVVHDHRINGRTADKDCSKEFGKREERRNN